MAVVMPIVAAASLAAATLMRAPSSTEPAPPRPFAPGVVTWPSILGPTRGDVSRSERHALLHLLTLESDGASDAALRRAYREEDPAGRILALLALDRSRTPESLALLLEALRTGCDDERAVAIDLLAARGEREALVVALSDPIAPVAARAALALAGTCGRDELERVLAPYVDREKTQAILGLLAGIFV